MRKIYYKKVKDAAVQELEEPKDGCWIHIEETSTNDLEELARLIQIEYASLVDSLDKYEIPRIEKNGESIVAFARYPTDQEIGLYTSTLTLVVTPTSLATICIHKCLVINNFLDQKELSSTLQNTKLPILLLLKISQDFTNQIRKVRHSVLSAEKEMIHVESEDITALTKNEEILNQYAASLVSMRSVLEGLKIGKFVNLYEKEKELIDDCINSIRQSEELCNIVLKSIRSLRDSYQIIFANNLHKTIKLLTALTILLSIPTMIASIYGMNMKLPLAKSPFAFLTVMAITAILSIAGLWLFKRKRWL